MAPPHAYSGDPFAPERPMASVPRFQRLTRPMTRSSPPANPNAPPPTSMQSSVDARNPRQKLTNPDYNRGRVGNGRTRQASGVSPHGTRWSDAGNSGDSKWRDYGCDKECEGAPIMRVETETTIPGLSYDQAGRPVWRDPNGAVRRGEGE